MFGSATRAGGRGTDVLSAGGVQVVRFVVLSRLDSIPFDQLSPEERVNAQVFRTSIRALANDILDGDTGQGEVLGELPVADPEVDEPEDGVDVAVVDGGRERHRVEHDERLAATNGLVLPPR